MPKKKSTSLTAPQWSNKSLLIAFLVLIATALIGGLLVAHQHHLDTSFDGVKTTADYAQFKKLAQSAATDDKLTLQVTYLTGCRDCKKVKPYVLPKLRQLAKSKKVNLIVLNAADSRLKTASAKAFKTYFADHQITQTPTFTIKYKGDVVYQYAGVDKNVIEKLLAFKHPDTGEAFAKVVPQVQIYRNDFTHTMSRQPTDYDAKNQF